MCDDLSNKIRPPSPKYRLVCIADACLTLLISLARSLSYFFLPVCYCIPIAFANDLSLAGKDILPIGPRNILFSHISTENGLSQSSVNAIVQDKQGFIWFATQEGLNRYDGDEMSVYEHDHENPNSLSNDWVWTLFVDQAGSLWVGTDGGGMSRFDHEQNAFTHFKSDPDNPNSLSNDRVRVIFQDRQGIFWIGTDGGGLNRFSPNNRQFDHYQHDPNNIHSLPSNSVLAIYEDHAGNLWIGTNGGGLTKLDRENDKFTRYRHDPDQPTSLSQDKVRSIYEDRQGRLWIGTYDAGLNLFDDSRHQFKHFKHDPNDPYSLSHDRIRSIFQDRDGSLWIATDGGLNEWQPDTENFVHYTNDPINPSSLSDDRVVSIFQDRGGVLWVGTFNGINKWNYVSDAFTYFQHTGTQIQLSSNIITGIAGSANGEIWVGTYGGGLNRIDISSSSVSYYKNDPIDHQSLSDNRIMSVFVDHDQAVWVGTRNGGVNRLDPLSGKFTHYQNDPQNKYSLNTNSVTSILNEQDGTLWVGTYGGGLNRRNPVTGEFIAFRHNPEDSSTLGSDRVLAIYRDSSNVLWVGTEDGGLNRFNEGNQSFQRYLHNSDDPSSLGSNAAWAIMEGSDGSLWIGTGGGGLNRWLSADRAAGRNVFKKYYKGDGLRSDTVQSMLEDNAGFLWLSSNRGLVRFDPDNGNTRHFSRNNGLKGNEFNFATSFKSYSGQMFFGGPTGLVAFSPTQIRTNQHKPDIVLSAHSRLGPLDTSYSTSPLDQTIELGFREDLITFQFSGLDYASPDKNFYRYKLEGFDNQWTDPVQFKRTTYTSLPPGDYTFRVIASNNDGIWNEQGGSLKIQVTPPPWRTAWAYAIYTLIIGSVLFGYLRIQAKRLERETEQRRELERQVQLRTHELAERNEELQIVNEKLKEASWTDSLTSLKNRRFMQEFIGTEVAIANRRAKEILQTNNLATPLDISPALSFMMIDLDGFKLINDTYGHHAGDQALLQVRDILQTCCRKSDTIIRWGGDEFLIVSRNTNSRAVEKLAERIRSGLAKHQYQLGSGHTARLSGSIGFALYPFSPQNPDSVSSEQVIAIADKAAYVVKQNGRNAWVGIHGHRHNSPEDYIQIKSNLDFLVRNERVSIRTSIERPLVLSDSDKNQMAE